MKEQRWKQTFLKLSNNLSSVVWSVCKEIICEFDVQKAPTIETYDVVRNESTWFLQYLKDSSVKRKVLNTGEYKTV